MEELKEWQYVQHKHFNVGKMLLVKKLPNESWFGARYLAANNILVYSEYHINELEPFKEPDEFQPDVIFM